MCSNNIVKAIVALDPNISVGWWHSLAKASLFQAKTPAKTSDLSDPMRANQGRWMRLEPPGPPSLPRSRC